MSYRVNEIFLSLQGEGARAGTVNVFIRFANCNQRCSIATHGFDCDTEFTSGREMDRAAIVTACVNIIPDISTRAHIGIIMTGGEPLLQADELLVESLRGIAFSPICVETNGSLPIPEGIDYVVVSPKFAEHTLRAQRADELRYVRHSGQAIPEPSIACAKKYVSPAAFIAGVSRENLEWCIALVKANPEWALTMQYHKLWGVR